MESTKISKISNRSNQLYQATILALNGDDSLLKVLPPDVIRLIAIKLEDTDIIKLCKASNYFNKTICREDAFWRRKVLDEFIDNPRNLKLIEETLNRNIASNVSPRSYFDLYYYFPKAKYHLDFAAKFAAKYGFEKYLLSNINSYNEIDVKAIILPDLFDGGFYETAEKIISFGYTDDTNLYGSFLTLARKGNLEGIKYLVEKVNRAYLHNIYEEVLQVAARNGHLNVVKYIVEHVANVHEVNNNLLIDAAEYGHLNLVKYLVKNGADIHAMNDNALRSAANYGHLNVVKYLVENGANVHAYDDDDRRYAARSGHQDVVEYLNRFRSNISTTSNRNYKAL